MMTRFVSPVARPLAVRVALPAPYTSELGVSLATVLFSSVPGGHSAMLAFGRASRIGAARFPSFSDRAVEHLLVHQASPHLNAAAPGVANVFDERQVTPAIEMRNSASATAIDHHSSAIGVTRSLRSRCARQAASAKAPECSAGSARNPKNERQQRQARSLAVCHQRCDCPPRSQTAHQHTLAQSVPRAPSCPTRSQRL